MFKRRGNTVARVLVAILACAVAVLVWRPWEPKDKPPQVLASTGSAPVDRTEITTLADQARSLHRTQKWCEAKNAWEVLLRKAPNDDQNRELRREADGNLEIARSNCEPHKPLVERVDLPEPPQNAQPSPIPEDRITKFYPEGKTVRSIAVLNMTGSGRNKSWILEGDCNFAYEYRAEIETKVVRNRGTAVVFRQHFKDVMQLRAESKEELQLSIPESPISPLLWGPVEKNLLMPIPAYIIAKRALEIAQTVDPRFRRTLTSFHGLLKRYGKSLLPDDEVPIVAVMDKLAGLNVEMEYISGLGVTYIKVLDGKRFDPDDLERLAYNSSLLMDYFLFEGAKKADNEPFDVRVEDVRGVCSLNYDFQSTGKLTLRKTSEGDRDGEKPTVLQVVGGEVSLSGKVDGVERSGRIKPLPGGYVRYSDEKLLVRLARVSWQADTKWATKDHLLFGTENVRNVRMETYYEADLAGTKE
jgi:hypothetical protein